MPIDQDVHAGGDRVVDDALNLALGRLRIVEVSAVFLDAHGGANHAHVPVVPQPLEALEVLGVAALFPVQPHAAHATELHLLVVLVTQLGSGDVQPAVERYRCGSQAVPRAQVGVIANLQAGGVDHDRLSVTARAPEITSLVSKRK